MKSTTVPVMKPKLPPTSSLLPYLRMIEESRIYSNSGPLLRLAESKYAELLGVDESKVVLCSSATVAIEWAIRSSGFDEVQVPAYTFAATGLAAMNSGLKVSLRDVSAETGLLQPSMLASNQLPVVVAPFGAGVNDEMFVGGSRGVLDAAASLGNTISEGWQLPNGWVTVFSLHATKALGIGEGGLAVFGEEAWAEDFRSRINFGYVDGQIGTVQATNGKLSEFGAAMSLASIDNLSIEKNEWQTAHSLAERYFLREEIKRFDQSGSFHPYVIARLGSSDGVDRFARCLYESGIETRRWWGLPISKLEAFGVAESFPVAEELASTLIGLPMFRDLSLEVVEKVADTIEMCLDG